LLIKASGREYRKILGVLRKIDRPPLQVLINATLAEVTLNDNLAYGVQFFLQKTKCLDGTLGFSNGQAIEIAPTVPGLNFIVGSLATNPKIILDALARETAVRVVSSPSVVVLHNQPATLQVGDEVPITTRTATSLSSDSPVVVNEIQFRNTGVILKVTPRINSNGLVTMEIEQEISAVARTSGGGDSLTPTISQRRITSTIAVQSGQMVVLGGLISEQMDQTKSRVPIIGKIPYLGDVLGANTESAKARTELVVFLRPSVIRDPVDASNLTEAVRAGMQSLAPRPAAWDMNVQSAK
jgi:general secretion pathway protein D